MKTYLFVLVTFFTTLSGYSQLQFIENKGQWETEVNFKASVPTGAFFLEKKGFSVLLYNPNDLESISKLVHPSAAPSKTDPTLKQKAAPNGQPLIIHSHAYKVSFAGASDNVSIVPDKILPTYNNYFIGNDKSKWQSNCRIYEAIIYKNIYPNIDVRYYTDAGRLKYDIIVRPGANVNDIVMKYEGAESLTVKNKELLIGTSVGEVKELYPYSYQLQKGARQSLDCKYVVSGSLVRFKIGNYQPGSIVVIDPTVIFCSFTGSTADNWGYTATPGPDGSFFAAGIVFDNGYPVSPGAVYQQFGGGVIEGENRGFDIGLIKFSSNGAQRLYGTYLGGKGNEQPQSMICDAQGNLVLTGRSNSSNYPLSVPLVGLGGGYDIVVTKFNSTGTALIGSIKIGGSNSDGVNIRPKYDTPPGAPMGADGIRRNYGDDARCEVILDGNNNIYLASCSQSLNFPVINSNIQTSFGGGKQDGVIIEFTPNLSKVVFSTYFGGNGDDACFVLSKSSATGDFYVAGATTSTDIPGVKTNVISSVSLGGVTDGFITQLKPDGSAIIKTTYIGTVGNDLVYGIQCDDFGFPYIMGTTTGNWPVINASFSQTGGKQFICKLQPDLSSFIYSTVFGTNKSEPNLSPSAFFVDRCQNVYVAGWGGGINITMEYPSAGTTGMTVTSNAIQSTTDGADFYLLVLEKDTKSQLFGSFFGQAGGFGDHVDGGTSRFDANGVLYQSICANCAGGAVFPTTTGVWAPVNGSAGCNQAAVKIDMGFAGAGSCVLNCPSVNTAFISNVTGVSYQWQRNAGNGFLNINDDAYHKGTNTISLQLNNLPSSWYGYQYRCAVDGIYSNIYLLRVENYWTGAISTAWENPLNWSCGKLPDIYTDVFISTGTAILHSNTSIATFKVGQGATFVNDPGFKLTIAGH